MTRSTRKNAPLGAVDAEARFRRARFSGLPGQSVVTSCGVMQTTNNSSSATGYTSREAYKAAVACTDLQLVYPIGWYMNNSAELALAQANTIKAAIEYPSGTITPVFFNGVRSATADPWGQLTSDPVAVEIPAGAEFWVRTYIDSTTGEAYPGGFPGGGPGIATASVGYTTGDSVDSGTTWTNDWINGFWNPIVCGIPTGTPTPIYAAVGDSISVGTGDPNNRPWWKYGLQNSPLPAIAYTRSGCRADKIAASHKRGFPLLQGATHATVLLGVNDFGNSRTLAQVKADLTTIYTALRARGMRVIGCTLLPWTTSTDSWATTGNQTPASGFGPTGNRADFNAWIRAGADGLIDGYLELADSVETGRNTGIWKAAYTSDGIHPATVGHQAMGTVLSDALPALYTSTTGA